LISTLPNIGLFDWTLGVLFLFIIYFLAIMYKNKKIDDHPEYKYFLFALSAKLLGGLGFLLLSMYYWKFGDTFSYYDAAERYTQLLFDDPLRWLDIFFSGPQRSVYAYDKFTYGLNKFLSTTDTFVSMKITAIINLLCFRSYLTTTIMFSVISFFGLWKGYTAFCNLYPQLRKQLLFGFLLVPSILLWGSGILKDTITMACIGWLLYAFANIIIFKRRFLYSLIIIVFATIIIGLLKPYILYVLYPALFIWVQSNLKSFVKSGFIRASITPIVAVGLLISSYYLAQKISQNAGKYNVNKIETTLAGFQSWHETLTQTQDQSGYSLGYMEMTPKGILKKAPAAIEVTFFRPYLWEVRNASTLLGAIESIILLFIVVWLIYRLRLNFFRVIYRNKNILFLMIFALIFAVVVGISSYNFGALSRYKMPCQMFFIVALILIYDEIPKKRKDREFYNSSNLLN
jgi:hypothetical protein